MELEASWGAPEAAPGDEPARSEQHLQGPEEPDPVLVWAPGGRCLISGLLGLNVVLLGAALLAAQAFNPDGLKHQEPQLFLLLLMGVSVVWILWYLLWARRQRHTRPHQDHHAGGVTVTGKLRRVGPGRKDPCCRLRNNSRLCGSVVLLLFAAFSLLLLVCLGGYLVSMRDCQPASKVISPFIEAPFLTLQVPRPSSPAAERSRHSANSTTSPSCPRCSFADILTVGSLQRLHSHQQDHHQVHLSAG